MGTIKVWTKEEKDLQPKRNWDDKRMGMLNKEEQILKNQCEQTIIDFRAKGLEVGKALKTIQEKRLYRDQYPTFERYCKEMWEISRPRAYELIEYASTMKNLSGAPDKPTHENQVHPISREPKEIQEKVWKRATEKAKALDKRVSRKIVEQAKVEILGAKPKVVDKGKTIETSEDAESFVTTFNMRPLKDQDGDTIYKVIDEKITAVLDKKPLSTTLSNMVDERAGNITVYDAIEVHWKIRFVSRTQK